MHRKTVVWVASTAALCMCAGRVAAQDAQTPSSAETTVEKRVILVPGLRALDGDDDVANELTGWLRAGASALQGWRLHAASISLEQLMLVHGCEAPPKEACLATIGSTFEADRILSGSLLRVRPLGDENDYRLEARLFFFDSKSKRALKSLRLQIDRDGSDPDGLAVIAQQAVADLAEVPFDALGQRQATELRLARDGVPPVEAIDTPPKVFPAWPAAVSYAGTAVFVGLTAWSWKTLQNVETDPSFRLARQRAGPEVGDVCNAGTDFGVQELDGLCSRANTHGALQWVFLSMSAATAAVGTWLLVKSVRSRKSAERARLDVAPIAGRARGGVSARLRF